MKIGIRNVVRFSKGGTGRFSITSFAQQLENIVSPLTFNESFAEKVGRHSSTFDVDLSLFYPPEKLDFLQLLHVRYRG